MNEQMLQQYLAAKSDEERAWIVANALLETQPPDIREAVIAAAVPHWFDAEILAALTTPNPLLNKEGATHPHPLNGEGSTNLPLLDKEGAGGGSLYCAIRNLNLPFVQPFGELGLTLHDLTRAGIRGHLFKNEPERFKAYSRRAAAYFLKTPLSGGDGGGLYAKDNPQYRVEGIYHQLVENDWESRHAFWQQMETYCMKHGSLNLSAANMLLANLIELTTAGIVGGNDVERVLGVGYRMLGDLQQNRGSISAAEDSYQKAMTIWQKLAQADPDNTLAQQDVSIGYNRLGNLAVQRGDLNGAQQMFQQDLEIAERLAQADPANAQAQRDLSISYNKLGDLAVQRGDLNGAQQMFQQSLAIRERLAQPENALAQRDVAAIRQKLQECV